MRNQEHQEVIERAYSYLKILSDMLTDTKDKHKKDSLKQSLYSHFKIITRMEVEMEFMGNLNLFFKDPSNQWIYGNLSDDEYFSQNLPNHIPIYDQL
jgi:hypothetical protein